MITLLGTSHISPDSLKKVKKAINRNPDCVGVELDLSRYLSKMEGKSKSNFGFFIKIISKLQEFLGKRTGIFPGKEMFLAVELSQNKNIDTYLIDQEYIKTIHAFQSLPFIEKLKLFITPIFGLEFSIKEIPGDKMVEKALETIKNKFPKLYEEIIEKRDEHMSNSLKELDKKYNRILAIVGIGHLRGIMEKLEESGIKFRRFKYT